MKHRFKLHAYAFFSSVAFILLSAICYNVNMPRLYVVFGVVGGVELLYLIVSFCVDFYTKVIEGE